MERHLSRGIKEIISEFPKVGEVLESYNIGCVGCMVGTCALKDIVTIHNLPKEQEVQLMAQIEQVIYPERDVKAAVAVKQDEKVVQTEIKYSPPVKRLVDEHKLIKRFLSLVPKVCEAVIASPEVNEVLVLESVNFIRTYADRHHHAKEEDILFKYVDENLDVVKVMYEDHNTARQTVRNILDAVYKKEADVVVENLHKYKALLTEHIKKEDEILYPWIDRSISDAQVGDLFRKFDDVDERIGREMQQKYEEFVQNLENRFAR